MIALDLGVFPNDVALAFYRQMEALHEVLADLLVSSASLSPSEEEDLTRALLPIARIRQLCRAHADRLAAGERQDIIDRGRMLRTAARRGAARKEA